MNVQPFTPGATATLAVTNTSANVAIPNGGPVLLVTNAGTGLSFFRFGTGPQTAVVTDTPILPSTTLKISAGNANNFAAISATTATLYITTGDGM